MLGEILAITVTVASLAPIEKAYSEHLGYKAAARGKVPSDAAKSWDAPKVAGHQVLLMQPESGSAHYMRFVVTAAYPDYRAMATTGWNAAELLVKDPDAMAKSLRESPFKIIGEPRPMSPDGKVKAMQVVGPAQEVLYFTNPSSPNNRAASTVDRYFVAIDASNDLAGLTAFARDRLGVKVEEPMSYRLSVLNKALNLDMDTKHFIAVARIAPPFSVELDQYPKEAVTRTGRKGDLPPGMSMVTFAVDDLDAVKVPFVRKPVKLSGAPYNGRRSAVVKGPSGELFELVETKGAR